MEKQTKFALPGVKFSDDCVFSSDDMEGFDVHNEIW
jgi:hypothetical protein